MRSGAQTEDAVGRGFRVEADTRSQLEQARPRPRGQHLSVYFRSAVKEALSVKRTFRPRWAAGRRQRAEVRAESVPEAGT